VDYYEVQFKQTSQNEIDYGAVANSYTATIDYSSIANATTLELNYGGVSEPVTGADDEFASLSMRGDSTLVSGMKELEEFTFKVRAVTFTGKVSGFITDTIVLQGDQTAPAIPGSIVATGGIQQIKLDYELPSDSDLAYVEIFEATTNNRASSTLIVKTKSDQHTVTGLGNDVTRYYWFRSADRSGNLSPFSASFNATTVKIVPDDLAQSVIDLFAEGDAFGIEPVSTLTGVVGDHIGQVKLLTTTNELYVWTGSVWTDQLFTASSVDPGSITAASFASGVEPISAVNTLPSPTGYTGPSVLFLTTDAKLYRYDSAVPEFTTLIDAVDLDGELAAENFATDLRPVEIVSALPTTDLTEGRVVILTTDNDKMYRYTGTQWTKAISAADLDDQILAGNIATNAVTAGKIQAGAISTTKLEAGAVTAAKLNVSEVFADSAVIGAIQTSAITAAAIDAAVANFEFVEANNIAADAITAGKIAASAIETDSIASNAVTAAKINVANLAAISADVGTITAGDIRADVVRIDNVTLDTDGSGNLLIKSSGVDSDQIKLNALGTIKSDYLAGVSATQFPVTFNNFLTSTPYHKYSSYTLQELASITFTTPLTTSDTLEYVINLEAFASGTYSNINAASMITGHIQRTNSLGDSYDINGTRSGDDNHYPVIFGTQISSLGLFRMPNSISIRGGSTVYVKLYGYQYLMGGTPSWGNNFISAEALAR
jgi:hypothetical protein